jgi:hypothetical protein
VKYDVALSAPEHGHEVISQEVEGVQLGGVLYRGEIRSPASGSVIDDEHVLSGANQRLDEMGSDES